MTRNPLHPLRPILAACVAAIVLGATGYGAMAQSQKPAPKPPPGDLEQKMAALERRTQQLEQQLASMQAKAAGEAVAKSAPGGDKSTTVKAPFTVVDGNGKVVMRVQEEGTAGLNRGVYVFDAASDRPLAYIGAAGGGGRVYAATAKAARPEVQMLADPSGGPQFLLTPSGTAELVALNKSGISVLNSKGTVVSNIGLKDDRGVFEINDASGAKMVEAGSLPNHKGYVLANPFEPIMTAGGNPSMLLGGNKK